LLGQLGLLGRTRGRGRERADVGVGRPFGWAEPVRERRTRPEQQFLFFFLKNVNSSGICLFHLKFDRAPKIVKIFV
jgi:hypothetical protein